ncbi:TPA: hypothetical protein JBC64_04370 [Legionella pneumophila subsp. pneumophila]|nr:hypothetical protein [Legionella pneumophila]HAT8950047.1 hypothetical protein [Legionella pneumophila subsp. pneumophila]HAT8404825.1 hypothetical protein [Legionella pneumophila]HAT8409211.1 hypothetical protein [Legionella pneumophila]HAT8418071.1 hypothetical protein [Legionella pneumophila]
MYASSYPQKLVKKNLPCVLFSVGRAVHSLLKPGKSRKARRRGQINRYKANDPACTATVFLVVFSPQ